MRINEHIYQGFFGLKSKVDSYKYYSERVDKLKGLDADLDICIAQFQKILENHNKKLRAYDAFLKKVDKGTLDVLKKEIHLLSGMFDPDELANDKEIKYVIKSIDILQKFVKSEESDELGIVEREVLEDLRSLNELLECVGPIWKVQLEFMKKNDEEIFADKANIKIVSDIFKEEGDILKMEEKLLRSIDLKTGTLMRKTTLKMRNTEKTKDMNLMYKEIKHIR